MKNSETSRSDSEIDIDSTPSKRFWQGVLTAFPFIFIPMVMVLGILAAWLMPWLSGAEGY